MSTPQPQGVPLLGHLWQWTFDPLRLLEAGAQAGEVFRLRLWRPVLVGYRPEWNKSVLADTDTYVGRGGLATLSPYLATGLVTTDQPDHRHLRRQLNPHFSGRAVKSLTDRLAHIAAVHRPEGTVDARAWASTMTRRMLNAALFGSALPDQLLAAFLTPLDGGLAGTMRPRRALFARMDAAIRAVLAHPADNTIAAHLAGRADAAEQLRLALAAGYDTTAHTLAWAAWHLAAEPGCRDRQLLDGVIDEVLRLYPAGWIGSRVAVCDTAVSGQFVRAGTLVVYSPYLTHRDPALWHDPHRFDPHRFATTGRAWTYLPFAAGPRTCLGAHLARLMLRTALRPLLRGTLLAGADGDPTPRAGLTLRPAGPLPVTYRPI